MFGLFCMSPAVSCLQHCGVLTQVDWTGLWVSKRPVLPALSLSIYLSLYCPNSNYETVVATSCLPCNAYAYAYASAFASAPPPHHMRMPQSNQQHKRSFSLHLPPLWLCVFSLLWFGRGSMFVPQFVACCHSAGELLAVHTCNQIAAPPDLRLACGLGNFIVPTRTRRTKHKERRNSSMIREFYTWNTLGPLDAGALTSS